MTKIAFEKTILDCGAHKIPVGRDLWLMEEGVTRGVPLRRTQAFSGTGPISGDDPCAGVEEHAFGGHMRFQQIA